VNTVRAGIERTLRARHGTDDFTVTTQQQMLDILGSVLDVLTFAVAALGGISLFVGGIGILTIMTIAVRERRAEIGLLRAIGARRSQVLRLFLLESLFLSAIGGIGGLALGLGLAFIIKFAAPALPVHPSLEYALLAELLAVVIGLVAGVLPARHASGLQPLDALRAE
jgi:putative ABC transport system permease protein